MSLKFYLPKHSSPIHTIQTTMRFSFAPKEPNLAVADDRPVTGPQQHSVFPRKTSLQFPMKWQPMAFLKKITRKTHLEEEGELLPEHDKSPRMLGEDFSEKPKLKEEMPGCDVSYTKIVVWEELNSQKQEEEKPRMLGVDEDHTYQDYSDSLKREDGDFGLALAQEKLRMLGVSGEPKSNQDKTIVKRESEDKDFALEIDLLLQIPHTPGRIKIFDDVPSIDITPEPMPKIFDDDLTIDITPGRNPPSPYPYDELRALNANVDESENDEKEEYEEEHSHPW